MLMNLVVAMAVCTASGQAASRVHRDRSVAHQQVRPSIVGGSGAANGSFPWLAHILFVAGTQLELCSGTVISADLVLTAGHCAEDLSTQTLIPTGSYRVTTGRLDWTETATGQVSGVSRTIVYPGFDPTTLQHDAALLVLSTPTTAPPIALDTSTSGQLLSAGRLDLSAGWGLTAGADRTSLPNLLQWAATVIQSPGYCAGHNQQFDPASELCTLAPYNATGTCQGDSGGPLIANYLAGGLGTPTQVGITSSGRQGCPTDQPGFFTRVDAISAWAYGWTRQLSPQPAPTVTPTPAAPTSATPAAPATAPSAPTVATAPATTSARAPALPTMSARNARGYARQTLLRVLGRRFNDGVEFRSRCARASASRYACSPSWVYGANAYYGKVTVYIKLVADKVVWADDYVIHWVRENCRFHTPHRRRCKVSTARGSY